MRIIIAVLFGFACAVANAAVAQELKGDPQAVALANKLIDRLGGAEIWSETRTLYLEYEGWRANPAQPVEERAWRDLREPRQKVTFEGRRSDVTFNMTPETSWLDFSERGPRMFDDAEHAENLNFWNFDFYTIIHNLARGDQRLRLEYEAPQTVRIKGANNADWGWFQIDDTGQPVRWGAPSDGEQLEYIYGPVKAYGNINFPAWGTAADGFWRFDYIKVDVSRHPLPVEITPPERE